MLKLDTLNPFMDTSDLTNHNPFKQAMRRLNSIGLGPNLSSARWEGEETFTQVQVDEKVNAAVAATKSGTGPFYDGFAEDIKGHPSITRYKSTEELAKGHLELEKKIGLKGVLVPSEGSSDDVKNAFFKATGRPEKSELYANPSLDNLHEGVKTTSEQDLKAFKDKAFEIGLSSKQFDSLYGWYLQLNSQRLTDYDKVVEEEKNTAATSLRQEWGAKYDANLALASGLAKKFGSEELVSEVGNNPAMIKLLANIGAQISEDRLEELGRSTMGMTPEQAKQEINKITKQIMDTPQHDPIYEDLIRKKDSLYKIAYPA